VPGLGQALNRRPWLAALFLVPSLTVLLVGVFIVTSQSPARLAAWIAAPAVLGTVLTLNLLFLIGRLVAVGQGFLDADRTAPIGRLGAAGLVVLAILVIAPHVLIYRYGTALGDTFARVFDQPRPAGAVAGGSSPPATPEPRLDERVNILIVGVDKLRWRPSTLTDTMMVASLDPVGKTISLLSVPRDLIRVPLGDGERYEPKLNSLMSYADEHPEVYPAGGIATLERALGALLNIKIHYYARMDLPGFVNMVDAVGGVDVTVTQGFEDPTYDGYNLEKRGWSVTAGKHHFDGSNALAFARSRKAVGETDFARASRQQQILIALREAVTKDGTGLLFKIPDLLDAVGQTIRTDLPTSRLPQLAAIVDEIGDGSVYRAVIRHPLVRSKNTQYGSSLIPNLKAIAKVAADLFPPPGTTPIPWPTPEPTKSPRPAASP